MKITVQEILIAEEKTSKTSGKPYTITSFKGTDGQVYMNVYGKFDVGKEYEMKQVKDNFGNDKWEVERSGGGFSRGGKSPEEQSAIQRQTALKAAVEVSNARLPFIKELPKAEEQLTGILSLATKMDAWLKGNAPITAEAVKDAFPGAEPVPDEMNLDI